MTRWIISMSKSSETLFLPLKAGALVILVVGIASCSYVPDWGNPVVWYDSVFTDNKSLPPKAEEGSAETTRGKHGVSGQESRSFPSLSSVPTNRPSTLSKGERRQVVQGLIADRDNARYTDQLLGVGAVTRRPKTEIVNDVKASSQEVVLESQSKELESNSSEIEENVRARLPKLDLYSQDLSENKSLKSVSPKPEIFPKKVQSTVGALVQPLSRSGLKPPYPNLLGRDQRPKMGNNIDPKDGNLKESAEIINNGAADPKAFRASEIESDKFNIKKVQSEAVPLLDVGHGQESLIKVFSEALAQSSSTVTTAPAGTSFGLPSAVPMVVTQESVPDIVAESYNRPLMGKRAITDPEVVTPFRKIGVNPAPQERTIVFFSSGSSTLSNNAKHSINKIVERYSENGGMLRVVGHASHRTKNLSVQRHKLINFRVSLDRAMAVANELIRSGIDSTAIEIAAVSDSEPLYYESMPEGEAGNRRAEIFYNF